MNLFEKACVTLRHGRLRRAERLWKIIRPSYEHLIELLAEKGLERVINGTDSIRILPKYRSVGEVYEPEVWSKLMSDLKVGDTFVDVGAFLGLYAVAAAKRVGLGGRVVAFEPDPQMYEDLQIHFAMNGTGETTMAICAAVGADDGLTWFSKTRESQNQILAEETPDARQVKVLCLDSFFPRKRIDILKIDVEGYEEEVLKGGRALLDDCERKPRLMFIEVHPYNWHLCGTTSESLLTRLGSHGYEIRELTGTVMSKIGNYGEIVAVRRDSIARNER